MHLQDRCIAMLDVLGFGPRISNRQGLLNTMKVYAESIAHSRSYCLVGRSTLSREHDAINTDAADFVFDTLVLVSRGMDQWGCPGDFMGAVSSLMATFASNGMPLRGAIGFGDYLRDDQTGVFLSDVFKKLNAAIQEQEWSGCHLLPDCEDHILDKLRSAIHPLGGPSDGLYRYPVPLKGPRTEFRWCLNWLDIMNPADTTALLEFLIEPKRHNTRMFIEDFERERRPARIPLPEEFKPARFAAIVNFGGSSRLAFYNELGESVRPGCQHFKCRKSRLASGTAFIGFNTAVEEAERERQRWT